MEDSILESIKNSLGINKEINVFDQDIIMHINSVFSTLNQLGVESSVNTYRISGSDETWTDYFGDNDVLVDMLKECTYLKVRIVFDPPTSSFVLDSIKAQAQELEWRINIQAETKEEEAEGGVIDGE